MKKITNPEQAIHNSSQPYNRGATVNAVQSPRPISVLTGIKNDLVSLNAQSLGMVTELQARINQIFQFPTTQPIESKSEVPCDMIAEIRAELDFYQRQNNWLRDILTHVCEII